MVESADPVGVGLVGDCRRSTGGDRKPVEGAIQTTDRDLGDSFARSRVTHDRRRPDPSCRTRHREAGLCPGRRRIADGHHGQLERLGLHGTSVACPCSVAATDHLARVAAMGDEVSFEQLFDLTECGDDRFEAISATYPWGQVYGGQVAAQGLLAAGRTVDPAFEPHSLHAYFVRIGTWDEPIIYDVDRIRDGRSFITRRVLARQSHGVILILSASFQRPETEPEIQRIVRPEDVPDPGTVEMDSWIEPMIERSGAASAMPNARTWIRLTEHYPDTPLMHAVAHTFTSDDLPTEAVEYAHPHGRIEYTETDTERPYYGASLDHAVWFHHLRPATDWTLHDFRSSGVRGGRGHASGELWSTDGIHVATVTQEVLLRVAR